MSDITQARKDFAPTAARLAGETVDDSVRPFEPGMRMSSHANWFVTTDDAVLIAVVSPHENYTIVDEILAYGLAWQRNRDLHLVLPATMCEAVLTRVPWIETEVRVWGTDGHHAYAIQNWGELQALNRLREFPQRVSRKASLTAEQQAWIADLHTVGLVPHDRSYLSWHHQGLQVLKVSTTRKGLRIQAGVQYSGKTSTAQPYDRTFTAAPTAAEIAEINTEVAAAVAHGVSQSSQMREHRMQATLANQGDELGLMLLREYPAYRGIDGSASVRPGRPGYIDFLGIDPEGRFHVVETKIGHDPCVVLQALDYALWVHANDSTIRTQLRQDGYDIPDVDPDDLLRMHLILGADAKGIAFNFYLAPQLEALTGCCLVTVHLVPDVEAHPLELRPLHARNMWTPAPLIATPVQGPRWADMLTHVLMGNEA